VNDDLAGSRLLDLTRSAQRLPHPALAVALAALFEVAPLALFVASDSAEMLPTTLLPSALSQTAISGAVYGPFVVQVWVWVARRERRPIVTLGLERGGAGRKLLRGAAFGVSEYLVLLALLAALELVEVGSNPLEGARGQASVRSPTARSWGPRRPALIW